MAQRYQNPDPDTHKGYSADARRRVLEAWLDTFNMLAYARAVDPIIRSNWEGTGVEPDVSVPAAQALEVATTMAAEKLGASG